MYAETKLNKTRGLTASMGQGGEWCKSGIEGKDYVSEGRDRFRREDFQSNINFTTSLCLQWQA